MPSWLASVRSWLTGSKTQPLTLPRRRDDVVDWVPPPARSVAASVHAKALVGLLQSEGKTGPVPHWVITGNYPELCWREGFEQLSERHILEAMGKVCAKVRINLDKGHGVKGKVNCYVIPGPKHRGNVVKMVPIRNADEEIPFDLPERARSGASHAQA